MMQPKAVAAMADELSEKLKTMRSHKKILDVMVDALSEECKEISELASRLTEADAPARLFAVPSSAGRRAVTSPNAS